MSEGRQDPKSTSPPLGTVTFLLTDIEGSTRLWEADSEAMASAVARHDALVSETVETFEGYRPEEQGEGDSVVAIFGRASEAMACAVELQRAFVREPWERGMRIHVRIALHTGEAQIRDGTNYYGQAIIRCARLRSIAHGGQILASRSTHDLVQDRLPEGVTLKDLGPHRLKDLTRPERVFQVCHPDLTADFPRLPSLEVLPNNLPLQLTTFIGRESEIKEIESLLHQGRLVTIIGAGGAGKTRLAQQAAADLLDTYPDGVWWVDLAAVGRPDLVAKAAASALAIREVPMQPMVYTLQQQLRDRNLLLLLDNCEHLISACAELAQVILQTCPSVSILATSQEPLGLAGETAWRIPSLSMPAEDVDLGSLPQYESVRLFLDRVGRIRPDYRATPSDAGFISEICRTLDGMPLAIELAAARTRLLSLKQIAGGLDDRFRLLVGGSRTALPRHQTLLASVDWSHGLLGDEEKMLFRRLSVFPADFTLAAAESICSSPPLADHQVLELISQLVDKSLVRIQETGTSRFRLRETIRQYARLKLRESGEESELCDRHLDFYLDLAERSEPHLESGDTLARLEELDEEHANLRAALDWCEGSAQFDRGLRLATALEVFWLVRAHISEGKARLEKALQAEGVDPALRARGLIAASAVADWTGDFGTILPFAEEALKIGRELDEPRIIGRALAFLGSRATFVEPTAAGPLLEESVAVARGAGDQWGLAFSLNGLGLMKMIEGKPGDGAVFLKESLTIARSCGDRMGSQRALRNLGTVLTFQGRLTQARVLLEEAIQIAEEFEDTSARSVGLTMLGLNSTYRGEYPSARENLTEALKVAEDSGSPPIAAMAMCALGVLNYALGDFDGAVPRLEQGLALLGAMNLDWAVSAFQAYLGDAYEARGDLVAARAAWEEAYELARRAGLAWTLGRTLRAIGKLRRLDGDMAGARSTQAEAIRRVRETGDLMALTDSLEELAMVIVGLQDFSSAARLFGAVQGVRRSIGYTRFQVAIAFYETQIDVLSEALGNDVCEKEWAEGLGLSPEAAISLALGLDSAGKGPL